MISLLAHWIGGAANGSAAQPGYRSLLAHWVGGAANGSAAVVQPGYRSLLAFWAGGAYTLGEAAPAAEVPQFVGFIGDIGLLGHF